jgi:hypothetical protein
MSMADIEQVLIAWLKTQFPAAEAVTETPASPEFEAALPIIKVVRVGGGRRYSVHSPSVIIECFATGPASGQSGRPAAKELAGQVAEALYGQLPGTSVNGAIIGHVAEVSGPSWAPWDNTNVRRFVATYQIHYKATT